MSRAPLSIAIAAFVTGSVLAVSAGLWQTAQNKTRITNEFAARVDEAAAAVVTRLDRYQYGLRGARGAAIAGGYTVLDAQSFERYGLSRNVTSEFPGARGFGIVRRIGQDDEASFVAEARILGQPDFEVHALTPHDGDRFVIQYIAPKPGNSAAIGLDIASESSRRDAAEAAARSGMATLTRPITLVQVSGGKEKGFLLLLPIYQPDKDLSTREARERASFGWSYAPLVIDEVMSSFDFGGHGGGGFSLSLRDRDDPVASHLFYASPHASEAAADGVVRHVEIPIYGRIWVAEFRAREPFIAALNLRDPGSLTIMGIALAALCATLVFQGVNNAVRSAQLREERDRRAAIVDASSDAIVAVSMSGTITSWNPAATHVFGYSSVEALGQPVAMLQPDDGEPSTPAGVLAEATHGSSKPAFEAVRRRRDGTAVDVSISASPLRDTKGRMIGLGLTIRDVSEQRVAQEALRELSAALEVKVEERTAGLEAARRDLQITLDWLRESQAFLDRTGRVAGVGGWELDVQTQQIKWSAQVYRIHEVDPSRPPRLEQALNFYAPEARPIVEEAVARAMADGTSWDLELPFVTATGRSIWVRSVGEAESRDGKVVRLLGAFQDVSERHLVLEKLSRSNERFALASDSAGIGVWERDLASGSLLWDERTYRLFGLDGEAGGDPANVWAERVHADDLDRVTREMKACIAQRSDLDSEFRVVWPSGEIRHLKAAARVRQDEQGRSTSMIGVNIDITGRKRAELELGRAAALLRTVLESATEVAIVAVGTDGKVNLFNSGAERMLGYARDEVIGQRTSLEFHDADELCARALELSLETGRRVRTGLALIDPAALGRPHPWSYVRKDGSHVPVSLSVTAMHNADGECFGYLGVAHDVTQQVQYEASLKEAVRLAEHANLAKSQFLANMSHEIRTPMNAVIGLSYMLGHTSLDATQADFLDKIKLASKSLLGVINDILDLSKIEAGELHIESAAFSLARLLRDLEAVMHLHADAKQIAFGVESPPDLAPALVGDSLRLQQILTNLLANAVKFTSEGGVRLVVHQLSSSDGVAELRFEVHDTGIGIADADAARLFEPFAQADTSTTRRFGGTGLGLSIVRQLAHMMGGRVGLESTPGRGSTFWVELRLAVAADDAIVDDSLHSASGTTRRLPGVRVLVVDDSQVNLDVARHILELAGASVAVASNGQQAVDRLRMSPGAFDVVLMDVQMPVLDGHAATRCIRGELGLTTLPIIALTAGALTSQHEQALAAGMDDFVSKPFDPHDVIDRIRRLVPNAAEADAGRVAQVVTMPAAAAAEAPNDWPTLDEIDGAGAARRLSGDSDLFRSLLGHLLEEFSETVLAQLVDVDDVESIGSAMHKLKGSAGNIGASRLHEAAGRAETAARNGNRVQLAESVSQVEESIRPLAASGRAMGRDVAARRSSEHDGRKSSRRRGLHRRAHDEPAPPGRLGARPDRCAGSGNSAVAGRRAPRRADGPRGPSAFSRRGRTPEAKPPRNRAERLIEAPSDSARPRLSDGRSWPRLARRHAACG